MNGIFGFGIDTVEQMDRSVEAIASVIKSGGLFILGWDTDKTSDPAELRSLQLNFRPIDRSGFLKRTTFPSSTHVYDFHEKAHCTAD